MAVHVLTGRDKRLIDEFGITSPEAAEAELQRRGIPYLLESRNDLEYRHHHVQGPGWACWSQGRGYVAGSKLAALLRLLEAQQC